MKSKSMHVELAAAAARAALDALKRANDYARESEPAGAFSIGKPTDKHLRGDLISEQTMISVVNEWGKKNGYLIHWFSEEHGKMIMGKLDEEKFILQVTADGIDGTEPYGKGEEAGVIITIALGADPLYSDIVASAVGLIERNVVIVADVLNKKAFVIAEGEWIEFETPRTDVSPEALLMDDYTAVAKDRFTASEIERFRMTGSTAYTIYLVAFQGYGLLLDATDKLNFEQHSMFAFAAALGLIFETFEGEKSPALERMLSWQMNPDQNSLEQAAFYFVPNKKYKDCAIELFG
jgi:fructose-1,6-bisphosphatase/inositol monophosphatase family enzyme